MEENNNNNNVYVVTCSWGTCSDEGSHILGVFLSRDIAYGISMEHDSNNDHPRCLGHTWAYTNVEETTIV